MPCSLIKVAPKYFFKSISPYLFSTFSKLNLFSLMLSWMLRIAYKFEAKIANAFDNMD